MRPRQKPGEALHGPSRPLLGLCAELLIPVEERDLQVYDVMNAREALLTTTP